jgi:surfeit locus 1 family protein
MSFTIGNRVFAPRPAAVAFMLMILGACVALGYWQIGRGREKQALLDAFERGTQASVELTGVDVDGLDRYQHVIVRGHYLPERQILLDSMPSATGLAGYRVLTPLERSDGRGLIVVDRGWLAMGLRRDQLPFVGVSSELRLVRGRLDALPVPGIRLGAAGTPGDTGWPRVLLFPTVDDLEAALGAPVAARILLLDADVPDGYERKWQPSIGFGPGRHLGYAIQWFTLALTAMVAFVAISLRRKAESPAGGA